MRTLWLWTKLNAEARRRQGLLALLLLPVLPAAALEPPPAAAYCHPAYYREALALPLTADGVEAIAPVRQDLPLVRRRPERPALAPSRPLFPAAALVLTLVVELVAAAGLYGWRWRPSALACLQARLTLWRLRWRGARVPAGVLRPLLVQAGRLPATADWRETLRQVRCRAPHWLPHFQEYYDSFRRQ